MTFRLFIRTNNEAFEPFPEIELARLLRKIAAYIEEGGVPSHYQTIFDVNGNDVGRYAHKDDES